MYRFLHLALGFPATTSMPNTSQDFLDQAKAIQVAATGEMELRTATNRGYYSVYHNASDIKNKLSLWLHRDIDEH
jgi:hypothetical protein